MTRILLFSLIVFFPAIRAHGQRIRVGAKNFTEQQILGEIVARSIEIVAESPVERVFNLGGTGICHGALVNGAIDIYVEYTGTALVDILRSDVRGSADEVFAEVSRRYREEFDAFWFPPFGFENTYALVVKPTLRDGMRLTDVSDLLETGRELVGGFTSEFIERPDGLGALNRTYGLRWKKTVDLDPGLLLDALCAGNVDVAGAFSTEGRIDRYGLRVLRDDRRAFPPYAAAPVLRSRCIDAHPEIREALFPLAGAIDGDTMRRLNNEVTLLGRSVADVASDWISGRRTHEIGTARRTSDAAEAIGVTRRIGVLLASRGRELFAKALEHAALALAATAIAFLFALPGAIWVASRPRLCAIVIAFAEAAQTVPSLALLAFLFAMLHRLGLAPALSALVIYSLLPILLNTVLGLRRITTSVREAAESLGLAPLQVLLWVELPQAVPSILAGVRIAIVLAVGAGTLSTFVGAGGLGDFIARGLARNDPALTLIGAVPAALMAITFSALLRYVTPEYPIRSRR